MHETGAGGGSLRPAARDAAGLFVRWGRGVAWAAVAVMGAAALSGLALHRGESINAGWFIVAALCVHLVAYRFYSAWIATRVLIVDPARLTPAVRLENGRYFVPGRTAPRSCPTAGSIRCKTWPWNHWIPIFESSRHSRTYISGRDTVLERVLSMIAEGRAALDVRVAWRVGAV